ncbi:MULE transposase domain-containing protein, partial [Trichomonas vaginalis G3]
LLSTFKVNFRKNLTQWYPAHTSGVQPNLRLDELVIELYSSVVPSFLIKLQIKGLDSERSVKVIKKVTRDFEEMTQFKKVECISLLEAVQKGLKNDTLDPNIVYSTLKILLQRKHLI